MGSIAFVALVIFAYFLGGIPFGLLYGRLFADIDIRSMGSGNIGATNVNRVLGRKLGAATLLSDVLKAVAATLLAAFLLKNPTQVAFVGFMTVVGHCFPIYLKFQGGKGVATAFGMALVVAPLTALVSLMIWLLTFRLTKISSLGALVSAAFMPFFVYVERDLERALVFCLMLVLIVIRHRENIDRLRKGKELSSRSSAD